MRRLQISVGGVSAFLGLAAMDLGYLKNVEPAEWLGLAAFAIGVSVVYFSGRRG